MLVAVLDTNTLVSALLSPRGVPSRLLEAARAQQYTLATSAVIVEEVLTTLHRDKIRRKYRIATADIGRLRDLLERELASVRLATLLDHEARGVATHPEDDLILTTALAARADYLVTGDTKLQRLGCCQGVTILTPRDFLEVLESQPPE